MILSRPNIWHSMQKQTQKRLKSGFKIISWTVSTLEGGGSIMLPALYTLSFLRYWLARNARAYTSARSIGFCVIWVCISSSSSSICTKHLTSLSSWSRLHALTSSDGTSCSACHELLWSCVFLILFCGVRDTHKFLAFCELYGNLTNFPSSPAASEVSHLRC